MSDISEEVRSLRTDYQQDSLAESDAHPDPLQQFSEWMDAAVAAEVPESNAMTLATISEEGLPSARIVLLRGFDEFGFRFYTNYSSQKGTEIAATGEACLVFFWPQMERQVRISGSVQRLPAEESDDYYHSRPRESQISAWASPQSSIIPDREFLEAEVRARSREFEGEEEIPRPKHWGGYVVEPRHIEFWQGRSSRLHDRLRYDKDGGGWRIVRLAP